MVNSMKRKNGTIMQYFKKLQEKNHMIILIDAENDHLK